MTSPTEFKVQCCIAGGGPAGMMAGLLLARQGVEVVVLEKHADFLRDFRGDTVHPSTLEVIYELGLIDEFLKRPHQKARRLIGRIGNDQIPIADFTHLKVHCPYIALMPQWEFLDFLSQQAKQYPNFRLIMQAEVSQLIMDGPRVIGVKAKTPDAILTIKSDLVIGADGRHSTVRKLAGLEPQDFGAPMDVLWMRLSWQPGDPTESTGSFTPGRIMALINRETYWQCAYVIPKGMAAEMKKRDIAEFRQQIGEAVPFLSQRANELKSWDDVKLLTVTVDRLPRWWMWGLICIGDAAHAMSPLGGVGINLAIQDAVAAANVLAVPLKKNLLILADLMEVQDRREFAARATQRIQLIAQNRIVRNVLGAKKQFNAPFMIRVLGRSGILRRIVGYMVGIGAKPEHIR